MPILYEKIQQYKGSEFRKLEAHYRTLKDGQSPHTLLLTCSDSRVSPQEISLSQAGEVFVIRNAGNLIAPYNPGEPTNEGLSLEFGVQALGVKEVVVMGHASCGAMGGLMDTDKLDSLPLVQKGLKKYKHVHSHDVANKNLEQLTSWNVDNQLRAIFSYPFVQEKLDDGSISVYGMVYDFVNGEITYRSELRKDGEVSS